MRNRVVSVFVHQGLWEITVRFVSVRSVRLVSRSSFMTECTSNHWFTLGRV